METRMMRDDDSGFEFLNALNGLPFPAVSARLAAALMSTWRCEGLGHEEFDEYLRLLSRAYATSPDPWISWLVESDHGRN
jgi:hypothetical protein